MKHLNSLRERLGLPPPSEAEVVRLHRDVEEVMQSIPEVRRWREDCRSPINKRDCDRDVFGNCDQCDRRAR